MKRKQIQLNVCKAMMDADRCLRGGFINENEFCVTPDGYTIYVFDISECVFDIAKIPRFDLSKYMQDNKNDEEIKLTDERFIIDGKVVEKYKTNSFVLYAFQCVSAHFKGFHLFANSETSRILAKDDFGRLVGAFLPMRFQH